VQTETILVVDDSPATLEVIERNLSDAGYAVFTAPGVSEAIDLLKQKAVDLVVTDLKMPKVSGMELIRHVRSNLADTGVIMITGFAAVDTAVEAVKQGAENYLPKPFTDDELLTAVRQALDSVRARREGRPDRTQASAGATGLLGDSAVMRGVLDAAAKAASTSATVLITGESGTGKELVARAIHYGSARAAAPFVPVNCAAIPDGLVESELFGHVRGAFTGAVTTRAGFFITADGGSIFLDEIGELSLGTQGKLLRVLEDGQIQMIGAARPRPVDVRILSATNKNLHELVRQQRFREDLYFRLNVIPIEIAPLRQRREDIVSLLRHFADKYAAQMQRSGPQFTDRALDVLRSYHWPGNVRELENVVQRLVVMTEGGAIDVPNLPPAMRFSAAEAGDLESSLEDVENRHIRNVLASVGGNKTRAARILGIDRKTLREKLKQGGLPAGEDDSD
jgi:DNA-binding NtrC family response regulator